MTTLAEPMGMRTVSGTAFAMFPPHTTSRPTLLLLALSGVETLRTKDNRLVGQLLYAQGWNVASLDLPCHGADSRQGEPEQLDGWAARTKQGEDIVAAFQHRVNDVVAYLLASGMADPARIAAAGISRGGFMALHAAAGNPHICAVAALAPVTDLHALREFTGQEANPLLDRLAIINAVDTLATRALWLTIGNRDDRVGTDKALAFAQALIATGEPCRLTLHVLDTPGHASFPAWHDTAAAWFEEMMNE